MSLVVSALLLVALFTAIFIAVLDNPRSEYPPMAAAPAATQVSTEPPPSPTDTGAVPATETAASEATSVSDAETATAFANESAEATPTPTETLVNTAAANPTATSETTSDNDNSPRSQWASTAVRLGEQRLVEEAGFAFRPATGYSLDFTGDSVTLSAGDSAAAAGALMLLRSEAATNLVGDAASDLDDALSYIIESMSSRRLVPAGDPADVMIGGTTGQAIDIVDDTQGSELAGRIAVARPDPDRIFLGVAFAPASAWADSAREDFDAVLNSVEFFPVAASSETAAVSATPPTIDVDIAAAETPEGEASGSEGTAQSSTAPEPAGESPFGAETEWRIASNGNFVNQISTDPELVWAATDGGVLSWDKAGSGHVKFTTLDGLSTNRIASVVNCPLPGIDLVFATDQGLQVYDQQNGEWTVLDSTESGMSHDDVSTLYCDAEQGLLIVAYARHGLDLFSADSNEWTLVDENNGLETGIIRKITVTSEPLTIWVASQLGLTRYRQGQSTLYNSENSPMTANGVTALASSGADSVWFATAGDLYRTDGENWQTFNRSSVTTSDFPNGSITGLAVTEDGSVWIGSDQTQVCRFDPAAGGCAEFFSNEEGMASAPLTSLYLDANGELYYTTAGAGLSVYRGGEWRPYFAEDEPVAGNSIRSIAGSDNAVWVATRSGVSQIDKESGLPRYSFTAADSPLLSHDVRAVQPIAENSAWFGTAGGANFFSDPNWESYTEEEGLAGTDIRALALDNQNRNWIGSATGLSIWTGNGFFNLTTENGLPSENISALLNEDDLVWIGTDAGLLRFQDNQLQVFNTGNINLPSNQISALALDADGSLLIGTDSGLARFRNNEIVPIPDIPTEPVLSIASGADGEVWVSAGTGSLYHFDGSEWNAVPTVPELPSQSVSALYVDSNGDVWIGTDGGGLAVASR